jgi:L-idonate 5-dehydrogenase
VRRCRYCREGKRQHCFDHALHGSAMRFPHVQGGFRDVLVCNAAQAVPVPPHDVGRAGGGFAEPFAGLPACGQPRRAPARQARAVTGAGPIGALTVIAARRAGA